MSDEPISIGRRLRLIAAGVFFVALTLFFIDTIIDVWPAFGVHADLCKQAETLPPEERDAFLELIKRAGKVYCQFEKMPIARVNISGLKTFLSAEQGLVAVAALTAAIGGTLRSLLSLAGAFAFRSGRDYALV